MSYGPVYKYPEEIKELPPIDWTLALDGRTLTGSLWTATDGITITGDAMSDTHSVVRVSGGSAGTTYTLQNTVTWSDGQVRQAEITVTISTDDVP